MNEQEDFFSPSHNRLLSIATWAKYLAWIVLIVHVLWAIGTYIQEQNYFLYYRSFGNQIQYQEFMDLLRQDSFLWT